MKVVYRIEEPSVVRKTYDYAAWWTDIEIAPGDYEVRFVTIDGRECEPSEAYFARVTLQGKVVDEYMAAHFGGRPGEGQPSSPRGAHRGVRNEGRQSVPAHGQPLP